MGLMNSVPYSAAQHTGGALIPIGLVLHRTLASYNHVLQAMTEGPNARGVSVHFLVGKGEGQVVQMVDTDIVANHVGRGANQLYVGIEFESIAGPNALLDNLTPFQLYMGGEIVRWICQTHGIPKKGPPSVVEWRQCRGHWRGVLGHADVASGGYFHTNHRDEFTIP